MPRVLIISNAHSGRGHATRVVARAVHELLRAGISPQLLPVDRADPAAFSARFRESLAHANALILAGGDGTVHYSLPVVAGTNVPVYHLPLGTENLFSREFATTSDPRHLLRAVQTNRSQLIDLGSATSDTASPPTPFALMCSIGPDAGVIRRLHASRTGAISHLHYLRPTLDELRQPSLPSLTIEADGCTLVRTTPGMAVIANSRHYGARFNPAADAKVDDGLLDVVFFPAQSGPAALLWMLRALAGVHTTHPACVISRARTIRVSSDRPLPHQLDGELGHRQTTTLRFDVHPATLRILLPSD